jgi:hypothetical protein
MLKKYRVAAKGKQLADIERDRAYRQTERFVSRSISAQNAEIKRLREIVAELEDRVKRVQYAYDAGVSIVAGALFARIDELRHELDERSTGQL